MNKIKVKDIKSDQMVWVDCGKFGYESVKAWSDARLEDGVWMCDVTDGGDYAFDLIEGEYDIYDGPLIVDYCNMLK